MQLPIRVLFVCIGNSCRSQMAEGFARHKHADLMEPCSAGLFPAPIVQPETITCMEDIGIPLDGQAPKGMDAVDWESIDLLVNMSGASVLERVPGFSGLNLIWNVGDPIGKSAKHYRQSRGRIEQLLDGLAETLKNQADLPTRRPH